MVCAQPELIEKLFGAPQLNWYSTSYAKEALVSRQPSGLSLGLRCPPQSRAWGDTGADCGLPEQEHHHSKEPERTGQIDKDREDHVPLVAQQRRDAD